MLGPIVIVLVLAIVAAEIRWRDEVKDLRKERDRLAKEVSLLTDAIARAEKKPVTRPIEERLRPSFEYAKPNPDSIPPAPYWERQDEVVKIIAGNNYSAG